MTTATLAPDPSRIRVLAGLLIALDIALTALFAFAAVDSGTGESRDMFGLLAGSTAVGVVGAGAVIAALRAVGGPWTGVAVGAVVVSVALLAFAATRDGGSVLPLAMLSHLLLQWWLLRGLRRAVAG